MSDFPGIYPQTRLQIEYFLTVLSKLAVFNHKYHIFLLPISNLRVTTLVYPNLTHDLP